MKVKTISFPQHITIKGRAKNFLNFDMIEWRGWKTKADMDAGVIWVTSPEGDVAYTFGLNSCVVEWQQDGGKKAKAK